MRRLQRQAQEKGKKARQRAKVAHEIRKKNTDDSYWLAFFTKARTRKIEGRIKVCNNCRKMPEMVEFSAKNGKMKFSCIKKFSTVLTPSVLKTGAFFAWISKNSREIKLFRQKVFNISNSSDVEKIMKEKMRFSKKYSFREITKKSKKRLPKRRKRFFCRTYEFYRGKFYELPKIGKKQSFYERN